MYATKNPLRYDRRKQTLFASGAIAVASHGHRRRIVTWFVIDRSGTTARRPPLRLDEHGRASHCPAASLGALAANVGHTVYWAGPIAGKPYEFLKSATAVFIRYLPKGVPVGDLARTGAWSRPIRSQTLYGAAEARGREEVKMPGGGIALVDPENPRASTSPSQGPPPRARSSTPPRRRRSSSRLRETFSRCRRDTGQSTDKCKSHAAIRKGQFDGGKQSTRDLRRRDQWEEDPHPCRRGDRARTPGCDHRLGRHRSHRG